jgi:glycosyltransferase involved in cell wall biosynthesis
MIRVFGWRTTLAGEEHFRIGMPFAHLDPSRFEVTVGQPGPDIHDYDVVFVHRLAGPNQLWHELCADPKILAIYDMDDDLLCVDPVNTVPHQIFAPLAAETLRNVQVADLVTVTTPALAERYRQIHPYVAVLPICIPDEMPDWPIPEREGLTVGWAGGMHKRQDWPGVAWKLREYAELVPRARFRMIGADYTGGLLGRRCEYIPYQDDVYEFYRSIDFDIGIAPMIDTRFNRGKCHTKLIEYGARGIPTVASAIGEYVTWIEHGVNGLLVHHPDEWVAHLLTLTDDDTRAAMAKAAHDTARLWTISKHIGKWEAVFSGVMP